MELTYDEALATMIECTEIGYTIASQDRLWIVFIFDLWSEDDYRYNRIYPLKTGAAWAYDLDLGGVRVWTSRREAEAAAQELRGYLAGKDQQWGGTGATAPEVYVMNLGDDARYEAIVIGNDRRTRQTPKFKGSQRAWNAMIEMTQKWREEKA